MLAFACHIWRHTLQLSCGDLAGNAVTYAIVAGPTHGTALAPNSNGQVSYTATAGYSGADSFTYRATSADGTSNTATVSITDTLTAAAPSCSNLTVKATTRVEALIQLSCEDPQGNALTYAFVTQPLHGQTAGPTSTGLIAYLSVPNYTGTDTLTYKATASDGTTNTATVTITVSK